MNIEQIRTAAEEKSSIKCDASFTKIHVGSPAADANADSIFSLIQSAMGREGVHASLVRTGSFGCYDLEPIVNIQKPGSDAMLFTNVIPEAVTDVMGHLSGRVTGTQCLSEIPGFRLQHRVALRNCGWIDPDDIHQYILRGHGYTGLTRALTMNRRELTATRIPSALRGRMDSACSPLEAWSQFVEPSNADASMICNILDPDPGSLTSQLLLASDPHSILEGMLIGAYAAGIRRCFIMVPERTDAVYRLRKALDQMKEYTLLGPNILDSRFCAEIEIMECSAAMTPGYQLELFRCIEERQPLPHIIPGCYDFPEFIGKPALIVNPESMSALSAVLCNEDCFSETRVVTLAGDLLRRCTIEMPSETTIRSIIEQFASESLNSKTIKAAQVGGPACVFISPDDLDLPISRCFPDASNRDNYCGVLEVLDAESDIVGRTRDIMACVQALSCGKCVFCREGCLQILTILEDISVKGTMDDLDLLAELGNEMKSACLCAFGRKAPDPVLSGMKLFRHEFEERVAGSLPPVQGSKSSTPNART